MIVRDGAATGVVLDGRRRDSGHARSSRTRIRDARFWASSIRSISSRVRSHAIRNYRAPGTVAKVNLALRGLAVVLRRQRATGGQTGFAGAIHIGPGIDYLERAFDASKYGEISPTIRISTSRFRPLRDPRWRRRAST